MSDDALPELDDDAQDLLAAFRAHERLPAAVHERVWERVEADVEHERRARWLRRGAVVGMLAAAAVALVWVGRAALPSAEPREPASQAGYERSGSEAPRAIEARGEPRSEGPRAARVETPGASAPEGTLDGHEPATREPTIDDGPAVLTPESPAPRVPSRRAKTETTSEAPREPAVDPGDDLAEENRLLGRARRALIDEQPARALAQLDEHEQRFPRGVLTEERQALRAIALCEVGREVEGTAAARLFLREHPQAALSHRVRGACLE